MQSIRNSILRHVRVRGSIESWFLAEKQIKKCGKIDASKVMDGVLCYYRYYEIVVHDIMFVWYFSVVAVFGLRTISELAGAVSPVWDERQWEEDMDWFHCVSCGISSENGMRSALRDRSSVQ
nr:hypothetical protein CFP56_79340 [Quercus suber]